MRVDDDDAVEISMKIDKITGTRWGGRERNSETITSHLSVAAARLSLSLYRI